MLRPCIPVVNIISFGLHAFLRNFNFPCVPRTVIEIIRSFPMEQSPPRITPPKCFSARFIPLYKLLIQIQSVLGGITNPILIPIILLHPLEIKSDILLATAFHPMSKAEIESSLKWTFSTSASVLTSKFLFLHLTNAQSSETWFLGINSASLLINSFSPISSNNSLCI